MAKFSAMMRGILFASAPASGATAPFSRSSAKKGGRINAAPAAFIICSVARRNFVFQDGHVKAASQIDVPGKICPLQVEVVKPSSIFPPARRHFLHPERMSHPLAGRSRRSQGCLKKREACRKTPAARFSPRGRHPFTAPRNASVPRDRQGRRGACSCNDSALEKSPMQRRCVPAVWLVLPRVLRDRNESFSRQLTGETRFGEYPAAPNPPSGRRPFFFPCSIKKHRYRPREALEQTGLLTFSPKFAII